jgi:hypothetical protein
LTSGLIVEVRDEITRILSIEIQVIPGCIPDAGYHFPIEFMGNSNGEVVVAGAKALY